MNLTFIGAAQTVTGSKTLLEFNNKRILIDCGMFQGPKSIAKLNEKALKLDIHDLDYVFITHGHLDHCGYLPVLFQHGFKGKIICTELTQKIVQIILEDSVKVQEYNLREKKIDEPLYTEIEVMKVMDTIETRKKGIEYKEEDFSFEYFEAGHILGAASLKFTIGEKSFCFSGDMGRPDDLIHYPPDLPEKSDYVLIESTYGDKEHIEYDIKDYLRSHIQRIMDTGGVLLIPAFALARTQIVLKLLHETMLEYPKVELPIFVDSPMASKITKLYYEFVDALKIEKDEFLEALSRAKFVDFGKDQKKLAKKKGTYILISSSGMISGGKVLKYFDMFAKHEKNTIMLAGYQGEGTIGRRILDGEDEIKLFGHTINVRAHIEYLKGLSAHGDRSDLTDLLKSVNGLKKVFLNHGEVNVLNSFKSHLEDNGFVVEIAKKDHSYHLE